MGNNNQRFYVGVPCGDGTGLLLMFRNNAFQPGVGLLDQLSNAAYADQMPLNEMAELGASLVATAVASMRDYTEKVRLATVREVVKHEMQKPASLEELAKISAYFDGVNLDPSAKPPLVQYALQQKEEQDEEELKRNGVQPPDDGA